MRCILFFLIVFVTTLTIYCQDYENNDICTDTIDYENNRLYIQIPANIIHNSAEVHDSEGFVVMYPLISANHVVGVLTVDYSVMNSNHLISTQNIDIELWNTFNNNLVGSRAFTRNGLFNRIDRFSDGLEIYYTNISEDLLDTANDILKSVYIKRKTIYDKKLNKTNRKKVEYK